MTAVKTTGTYTPNFSVPGAPVTITNVTDKALTYFQTNRTDPDGDFFWDIVHPTTQGHALVAGLALQAINTVPEVDPAGLGSILALVTGVRGMLERRRLKAV